MDKSPDAFRTISEVAEALETPAHVLRFWESRFPQIRPVKRAGGRRYYRPSDVALLTGIKRLLHDEGMTIRGVQKILREHGIRHVARIGLGDAAILPDDGETLEQELTAALGAVAEPDEPEQAGAETAQIIALERVLARADRAPAPPVQGDLLQGWGDLPPAAAPAPSAPAPSAPPDSPASPPPDAPEAPMLEMAEQDAAASPVLPMARDAAPAPTDPAPESDAAASESTLAARLRALPPGALAPRAVQVAALQDRILGLRGKLAEATRRRAR